MGWFNLSTVCDPCSLTPPQVVEVEQKRFKGTVAFHNPPASLHDWKLGKLGKPETRIDPKAHEVLQVKQEPCLPQFESHRGTAVQTQATTSRRVCGRLFDSTQPSIWMSTVCGTFKRYIELIMCSMMEPEAGSRNF